MIKQRLGFKDFSKILCVGFSNDVAYSFKPDILEREVLKFIKGINSKRTTHLKSKKLKNGNETAGIQNDIETLIH